MKKGLILALMMVVAVGLAMPAFAEAPVIKTLPIVIVGNAEPVDTGNAVEYYKETDPYGNPIVDWTVQKSVLRYINAVDLLPLVDWKNPTYGPDTYHFYWSDAMDTTGIELGVAAGIDAWADGLTSPELATLLDMGTMPAASQDIFQVEGNTHMGIMNFSAMTSTTGSGLRGTEPHVYPAGGDPNPVHRWQEPNHPDVPYPPNIALSASEIDIYGLDYSPSTASSGLYRHPPTSLVNDTGMNFNKSWAKGWSITNQDQILYQSSESDTPTVLTMVAAVTSGSTQVMPSEPGTMEVYSLLDTADSTKSAYIFFQEDLPGKWVQSPLPAAGEFVKPGRFHTSEVGFDMYNTDNPAGLVMFASWSLGEDGTAVVFPLSATDADTADKIYSADLRMVGDAATADLCPGYRAQYSNQAFSHYGGVEVTTYDPVNAPAVGSDFTLGLAWEVPNDCAGMGDAGGLANWPMDPAGVKDMRTYTLIFDLFHNQYGDDGAFWLETVGVQLLPKPAAGSSPTVYSNYSSWIKAAIPGTYFDEGDITQTASSITIAAGSYNASFNARFIGAFPPLATAPGSLNGNPAITDGKLVHMSMKAVSTNVDTTPIVRMYLMPYMSAPQGTWGQPDYQALRNITWFDMYGAVVNFCKWPEAWGGRTAVSTALGFTQQNPGVPLAGTGSTLDMWVYTHSGYAAAGSDDYFLPNIQVLSNNGYPPTGGAASWPDDAGGITFSEVTIDDGS
jgi:hypothetical protein